MKKISVWLAILLITISIVSNLKVVYAQANTDEGTFVVGFDAEFPPYGYKDEAGEYVGFDLDLAQEVCNRRNWKLVKQPIEWNSKDMELNSGTIDCIWNGFTINGRENDYTWSLPYVDNSQVVVVKKDSNINSLDDLKGKNVAVQADSSALAALEGENATEENKNLAKAFKNLVQVGDYNSAFMNLESGIIDAIGMDIGVFNYQFKSRGDGFRMLDARLSTERYGIGFKKGNEKLRDMVQETLLEMKADGSFDKIAEKWNLKDSVCLENDENNVVVSNESGSKKIDILGILSQLSDGILKTILIFVLTLVFSMPLGLLVMFVRMSRFKVLQWIAKIYISIMRGTPLMLQLLVVFFGPYYIFKINTPYSYRFYAVIIGFSLNYAAYFAEIYRAGIQSIDDGQREASYVLGYNRIQTFKKIIFPQMVKNIMPPVTNEVITLVKDTSLAFSIAYAEMFTIAKQVAASQTNIIPIFVAGIFYYIFNFIVAFIMERIEKKLDYYK